MSMEALDGPDGLPIAGKALRSMPDRASRSGISFSAAVIGSIVLLSCPLSGPQIPFLQKEGGGPVWACSFLKFGVLG